MRHRSHHGSRHHGHHGRHHSRDEGGLLSDRDMDGLRDAMGRSHDYLRGSRSSRDMSPRTKAATGAAVAIGEVLIGLAANGYASARYENFFHPGGTKLPLDAVGGTLGVVAGAMGWLGRASPHVARLSLGVVGGYFMKLGMGSGAGSRATNNLAPIAVTAGAVGCGPYGCANAAPMYPNQLAQGAYVPPMGGGLTEAEMAAYARSY